MRRYAKCDCLTWSGNRPRRLRTESRFGRELRTLVFTQAAKPGGLERAARFFTGHERLPDESRSTILGHHHADADVDSQAIRVVPTRSRIECVNETVFKITLFAVTFANCFE